MKLLIIAGPYEADRIRRASLSAGFETVAVEPGESLSGWITASRPELIVMAPQIVHADPALALAKVRAVPRGRVPIFLVGDEADEARMRDLADGFFLRPVAPELLLERARAILAPGGKAQGSGPRRPDPLERTEMGLGPPAPVPAPRPGSGGITAANEFAPSGRTPKSGPHGQQGARGAATLKPLVATSSGGSGSGGGSVGMPARPDTSALMAELDAGIDALFDAELTAAVATSPKTQPMPKSGSTGPSPNARPDPAVKQPPVTPPATPPIPAIAKLAARPAAESEFAGEATKKVQPILLGAALQASAGERARARLLARYAPVERGDYFAVLGVGRDANASELRRAHERIIREIAPDAIEPQLAREMATQIDAIRAVAAEALRVLGDERLRPRYLSHLPK
jgi:hypothetical protein